MSKNSKTVLVTGGAGYIGSHTIIELLEGGYEVVSVDNFSNSSPEVFKRIFRLTGKKVKNYDIDLCDHKRLMSLFKNKKIDAIIHFAAFKAVGESVADPLKYYDNNINSLLGTLVVAKSHKIRNFIFSSSATVYDQNARPPYDEKTPILPVSPYGMTKKIGEEILSDYAASNSFFKCLSLRYFNPAGAHPSLLIGENPKGAPNNLIPVIVNSLKNKKSFSVFGKDYKTKDKTCIRDYIHVVDVARAHVAALKYLGKIDHGVYDEFNIGTGRGISVMEVIQAFEKFNDLELGYSFEKRRPGDVPVLVANTEKAAKLLEFKPEYALSDMVKTAWDWDKNIE